jgi:hypothetical protein
MGRRDDVVEPASVEEWARANPTARLVWLESGHELTAQIEMIWAMSAEFFAIPLRRPSAPGFAETSGLTTWPPDS